MAPQTGMWGMQGTWSCRARIAEPMAIFALIMAYIWKLRYTWHGCWVLILGLVLLSHALRKESAGELGFARRNLEGCLRECATLLLLLTLAMLAAGMVFSTTRPIAFDEGLTALLGYLPWGLLQQYLLNGYFVRRFETAWPRHAPLAAAALFGAAHLPNWFLAPVAFLAGYCCGCVYLRHRNLYFLGLAHGTIGFLLFLVVPDSISHHLAIGPGWLRR